jgi:hypothetical protein
VEIYNPGTTYCVLAQTIVPYPLRSPEGTLKGGSPAGKRTGTSQQIPLWEITNPQERGLRQPAHVRPLDHLE